MASRSCQAKRWGGRGEGERVDGDGESGVAWCGRSRAGERLSPCSAGWSRAPPPGRAAPAASSVPGCVLGPPVLSLTDRAEKTADSGPGSLRAAINTANTNGDPTNTITFAPRLAGRTITLASGELAITKSLDIVGLGKHQLTIKRSFAKGTPGFRIFDIAGADVDVTITGVTIGHGLADGTLDPALNPGLGGGIYHAGGTLKLTDVVLSDNQARGDPSVSSFGIPGFGAGGGIANVSGLLEITDSFLTNNRAQGGDGITGNVAPSYTPGPGAGHGGGLINFADDATVTITDSRLTGNRAQGGRGNSRFQPRQRLGAGIENRAGVLTITGSTFAHNQALGGNGGSGPLCGNAVGGGIRNGVGAVATITGSTFDHNRAIGGSRGSGEFFPGNVLGGGVNNQGRATITESMFTHNLANGGSFNTGRNAGGGSGGGLFNAVPATLTLFGCTFDHNRAIGGSRGSGDVRPGPGLGGGIDNRGMATITESTFNHNLANGGSFNTGSNAGVGWGGGLFNGFNAEESTVPGTLTSSIQTLTLTRPNATTGHFRQLFAPGACRQNRQKALAWNSCYSEAGVRR